MLIRSFDLVIIHFLHQFIHARDSSYLLTTYLKPFCVPTSFYQNSNGDSIVTDIGDMTVKYVSSGTTTQAVYAGESATIGDGEISNGDENIATKALLNKPWMSVVDTLGNMYISDQEDNKIRMVNATTKIITTVGGIGTYSYSGDGGPAINATMAHPTGLFIDTVGNILYFADTANNRIRKIDLNSGIISTAAGRGTYQNFGAYSGDEGIAYEAELNGPRSVFVSSSGNIFIADTNNNRIRMVNPSGYISTLAGSATRGYNGDNNAFNTLLNSPVALWLSNDADLFFVDRLNQIVRVLKLDTNLIITIAGTPTVANYTGDGGLATSGTLNAPVNIYMGMYQYLYVAEMGNKLIRQLIPLNTGSPTVSPTRDPTNYPTALSTRLPTFTPSSSPSTTPSAMPTTSPSNYPTSVPSSYPTVSPSSSPTQYPTASPTPFPTAGPSIPPSSLPTVTPSFNPSSIPTLNPTSVPTVAPTSLPTAFPSRYPSQNPTCTPSTPPTALPTSYPFSSPTSNPTIIPTSSPSYNPSTIPSQMPTSNPTLIPTPNPTSFPTRSPSSLPTSAPTNIYWILSYTQANCFNTCGIFGANCIKSYFKTITTMDTFGSMFNSSVFIGTCRKVGSSVNSIGQYNYTATPQSYCNYGIFGVTNSYQSPAAYTQQSIIANNVLVYTTKCFYPATVAAASAGCLTTYTATNAPATANAPSQQFCPCNLPCNSNPYPSATPTLSA